LPLDFFFEINIAPRITVDSEIVKKKRVKCFFFEREKERVKCKARIIHIYFRFPVFIRKFATDPYN